MKRLFWSAVLFASLHRSLSGQGFTSCDEIGNLLSADRVLVDVGTTKSSYLPHEKITIWIQLTNRSRETIQVPVMREENVFVDIHSVSFGPAGSERRTVRNIDIRPGNQKPLSAACRVKTMTLEAGGSVRYELFPDYASLPGANDQGPNSPGVAPAAEATEGDNSFSVFFIGGAIREYVGKYKTLAYEWLDSVCVEMRRPALNIAGRDPKRLNCQFLHVVKAQEGYVALLAVSTGTESGKASLLKGIRSGSTSKILEDSLLLQRVAGFPDEPVLSHSLRRDQTVAYQDLVISTARGTVKLARLDAK